MNRRRLACSLVISLVTAAGVGGAANDGAASDLASLFQEGFHPEAKATRPPPAPVAPDLYFGIGPDFQDGDHLRLLPPP